MRVMRTALIAAKTAGLGEAPQATQLRLLAGAGATMAIGEPMADRLPKSITAWTAAALATLTADEARVLRLRFGIEDIATLTAKEVAGELAVSVRRVRQIEVNALRKLRHRTPRSMWC